MAASENTPMLEVKNLGISFGGLRAVDNFNMTIEKGQLYGLIGPNGPENNYFQYVNWSLQTDRWKDLSGR